MQKPEKLNWKDTNMALVGSDLEKRIKAAAVKGEPQWTEVGNDVGLHVWRIEKFVVKSWPKRKYRQFHKGDSYVVLNTYKPDPNAPKLAHDVHIWIGSESTQDEYGTAAYKMVELDDKLGGAAVQHREVEEKESEMFLKYFDNKITYLRGGIESGFTHVKPTVDDPHLYHIKGSNKANSLRLMQIPVRRDCMNSGDVFVLVADEDSVWLWIGKDANQDEKTKGSEVARDFCKKGNVQVLEQDVNDGEKQDPAFWKYLPGKAKMLGPFKRSVAVRDSDTKDDKTREFIPILYQIKTSGNFRYVIRAKLIPVGPAKQMQHKIARTHLKPNGVYLLDTGFHVYLWNGSKADAAITAEGVMMAHEYFKSYRRPLLPVTVLKERCETAGFQQAISDKAESSCSCVIL
jgi:gelsolin